MWRPLLNEIDVLVAKAADHTVRNRADKAARKAASKSRYPKLVNCFVCELPHGTLLRTAAGFKHADCQENFRSQFMKKFRGLKSALSPK